MIYARLLGALAVITVIGFAYMHYQGLNDKLLTAEKNAAVLEKAVADQEVFAQEALSAIEDWKNYQNHVTMVLEDVHAFAIEAREDLSYLERTLSRHDLEKIAQSKPNLLKRRVNSASRRTTRMLTCASSDKYKNCGSAN